MICRLLGVPREDELLFRAWSDGLVAAADPGPEDESTETCKAGDQARMEVGGYLVNLAEQRRGDPGDDMLSAFSGPAAHPPLSESARPGMAGRPRRGGPVRVRPAAGSADRIAAGHPFERGGRALRVHHDPGIAPVWSDASVEPVLGMSVPVDDDTLVRRWYVHRVRFDSAGVSR
ncbi:hypothetical protein ACH41H_48400 [Streptomyces sp. NPDC020800]|uniref:hypothetical protein n=1 Tax=Streptomyces sp. NPDC020800 TaxID=3365092 RepID=UPI0037B48A8A